MNASSPLSAMLLAGAGLPVQAGTQSGGASSDGGGFDGLVTTLLASVEGVAGPSRDRAQAPDEENVGDDAALASQSDVAQDRQTLLAGLMAALAPQSANPAQDQASAPSEAAQAASPPAPPTLSAFDVFLALRAPAMTVAAGATIETSEAAAPQTGAAPVLADANLEGAQRRLAASGLAAKAFATLAQPLRDGAPDIALPGAKAAAAPGAETDKALARRIEAPRASETTDAQAAPGEPTKLAAMPAPSAPRTIAAAPADKAKMAIVTASSVTGPVLTAPVLEAVAIEAPPAVTAADAATAGAEVVEESSAALPPASPLARGAPKAERPDSRAQRSGTAAASPAEAVTAAAPIAAQAVSAIAATSDDDTDGGGAPDPDTAAAPPPPSAADAPDTPPPQASVFSQVMAFANQVKAAAHTVSHLATQIVSKVAGKTTQFDVALDPIGLGRVNVQVQIDAAGQISAALSFDNPQAAADLRARAGELHRALTDAGFDIAENALSFDLSAGSGDGSGREAPWDLNEIAGRSMRAVAAFAEDAAPSAAAISAALRRAAGGLDIRI